MIYILITKECLFHHHRYTMYNKFTLLNTKTSNYVQTNTSMLIFMFTYVYYSLCLFMFFYLCFFIMFLLLCAWSFRFKLCKCSCWESCFLNNDLGVQKFNVTWVWFYHMALAICQENWFRTRTWGIKEKRALLEFCFQL